LSPTAATNQISNFRADLAAVSFPQQGKVARSTNDEIWITGSKEIQGNRIEHYLSQWPLLESSGYQTYRFPDATARIAENALVAFGTNKQFQGPLDDLPRDFQACKPSFLRIRPSSLSILVASRVVLITMANAGRAI